MVAAAGAASVGASIAAGLLLGASSVVAVLAYALVVGLRSQLAPRRASDARARAPAGRERRAVDVLGDGEPLVLLHGLATTRAIWRRAAPLLADPAGRDARRAGVRAAPPAGRGFDLDRVADRVIDELRGAVGAEPVELVGHSLGAAVALTLAVRHPAPSAASCSSPPRACARCPSPSPRRRRRGEALHPGRRRAAPLAAWGWGRRLLMAGGVVDGAALAPASCASSSATRAARGASAGARHGGDADLRPALAAFAMPVGALWGAAIASSRPAVRSPCSRCGPARSAR